MPLSTNPAEIAWPIGSVFISVVATDPSELLGVGTWSAIATGRVLVGIDTGDTDFDVVEESGGAKTHTLVTAEIPAHNHTQVAHSHLLDDVRGANTGASLTGFGGLTESSDISSTKATAATTQATPSINNTGGGGAHNNLQPYFVVYMWKRTA